LWLAVKKNPEAATAAQRSAAAVTSVGEDEDAEAAGINGR